MRVPDCRRIAGDDDPDAGALFWMRLREWDPPGDGDKVK